MSDVSRTGRLLLGRHREHNGLLTILLTAVVVSIVAFVNAGRPLPAAGLYVIALVVAGSLVLTEAAALRTWLFGNR